MREGFARDPERVNAFYDRRRRELMQVRPSAAHDALAVLETMRPREVLIVTRNIDDSGRESRIAGGHPHAWQATEGALHDLHQPLRAL